MEIINYIATNFLSAVGSLYSMLDTNVGPAFTLFWGLFDVFLSSVTFGNFTAGDIFGDAYSMLSNIDLTWFDFIFGAGLPALLVVRVAKWVIDIVFH